MSKLSVQTSVALGLALIAGSTSAADPFVNATWGVGIGTKPVYIHTAMPPLCDNAVLYGINVWNGMGASFAFTWPSNPITGLRENQQTFEEDRASITIEDGPMQNSSSLMETGVAWSKTSYTIYDADTKVRSSFLFYGDSQTGEFHCAGASGTIPPADKFDYQSAIEHELGHALGFQLQYEYTYDPTCIMYYGRARGELNRNECAGEYNAFRAAYGIR